MSFSFGTPSSAPATTGLGGGGFSFGAAKPATPGFGLTATSQPSTGLFGSTPATSAPAFGTTTTPAFGAANTSFGGANTSFGAANTSFGAANTSFGATSTAPAFGATNTPSFGATPAFGGAPTFGAASAAPTFGATSAPTFGSTTTPAFGATTTPAFGTTSTPAFGATGLGTGGLNFGGASTSTAAVPTFGATTTTAATTGLGGLGGFSFGGTTATTGLWGATSSATTSSSLFGTKLGTTTVTGTQPSTLGSTSLGLGGVAPSTGTGNAADVKTEPPKQQKLPNEISTTIDTFKEFVKKQKSLSSDVMRVSIKPLHKVAREAESTLRLALSLSGEVSRARAHSRRLRSAAAAALAAAEGAAREAAQPGLELERSAPPAYVKELISELEQQLITFRRQMEVADKQMQSSPKLLTEQELTLGIRRMHESLVALAGRLQAVHAQVEAQKLQYLNLRKYILKEPAAAFDPQPGECAD
ncbi:probable nucleoporin Nup58 isoform X5 [Ostrinia furnacalis]|uniref:probable nucleoporin Nup58 isoform X5 n=1 Tax=Ostrinia furnacalis TaxID=93504 RepID=UPI001039708E|nr:probable nucleoporin Nup58 isoform X5 [Ostrinia furnacalis]